MMRATAIVVVMITCAAARTSAFAQVAHGQSGAGKSSQPPVTHDDLQPTTLPPLPKGMTLQMIIQGDSIFHGAGNCAACHGVEAQGLPAAGDALTDGLSFVQPNWDSLAWTINNGIPQMLTRSPIQMPPRGGRSDLTPTQVQRVAAYIWAISQTRGEPWIGGHTSHGAMTPVGIEANMTNARARYDSVYHRRRRP
jgi:mono/diheme cytochrome c family protein